MALIKWARLDGVELPVITGHFEHGKIACPGDTLADLIRAMSRWQPFALIIPDLDTIFGQQEELKRYGTNSGAIDGLRGPKTLEAIKLFQTRQVVVAAGGPGYGSFGPKTKAEMRRVLQTN